MLTVGFAAAPEILGFLFGVSHAAGFSSSLGDLVSAGRSVGFGVPRSNC